MINSVPDNYTEAHRQIDLINSEKSLYYFGKHILGYEDAEPQPHLELCNFIQNGGDRKLLVGTRGIYKTCFGTVAYAIQRVIKNPNIRILIVQNTEDNAQKTLGEIKDHFDRNQKLRRMVPSIIPTNTHKVAWSKSSIEVNRDRVYREPTIMAAGVNTDLASLHFDLILGDDVVAAKKDDMKEGGMIILRPEEVEKAIGWYKITAQGLSVNRKGKKTEVQFIVNRWGPKDFAEHIMSNHLKTEENPYGFSFLQMAAHKDDGELLWPSVMTEEYLAQARQAMGDFMYFTQMECRPYNPADRGFPPELNVFWQGKEPPQLDKKSQVNHYRIYALMDMADVSTASSCYTSFVVLWVDQDNHIWLGEAIRQRLDTVGKIALIHSMVRKYKLTKVHIEENLYKETLRFVLRNAMVRENVFYRIEPLKPKNRNKDARILRLQPHHQQGAFHLKSEHVDLMQEMRDFPYTPWKDIIDSCGYIMDFIRGPIIPKDEPELVYKPRTEFSMKEMKDSIKNRNAAVYGSGKKLFRKQGRHLRDNVKEFVA